MEPGFWVTVDVHGGSGLSQPLPDCVQTHYEDRILLGHIDE